MGQILVGNAVAEFPSLHHAFFVGDILLKRDCKSLQSLAPNVVIVNMVCTFRIPEPLHVESQDKSPGLRNSLPILSRKHHETRILAI